MKKIIILSALILVGLSQVFAFPKHKITAIITGQVLDENQHPLSYATVALLRASDSAMVTGATTDSLGKFEIDEVNDGSYRVRASFIGYNDYKSSPVNVNGSDLNLGAISLKPVASSLSGVTIEGQRTTIEHYADKTVVNVGANAASGGQNVLDLLKKAPGVTVDNNNNISLNGKQGVLVLIDDKPTYMSAEQLGNELKNMPGEALSKIELMSTPPAQFDAQGIGGVINIITKKSAKSGLNGNVMISGGYGGWNEGGTPKGKASVDFNDNLGKVNLFGSVYESHYNSFNTIVIYRTTDFQGLITNFNENGKFTNEANYTEYKAGADYSITKNQTVGFQWNGSYDPNRSENFDRTTYTDNQNGSGSLIAYTKSHSPFTNNTFDLNYSNHLDTMGQKISANVDYARYTGNGHDSISNTYFDASGIPIGASGIFRNLYPGTTSIKSAKVDYSKPFKNGLTFEAGLKASMVSNDNSVLFDTLTTDGYKVSTQLTDHFVYTENINAAYAKLSKQWKKWQLSGGLRAEQTISDGNSVTTGEDQKRNYIDFFPSASTMYSLNPNNQFSLSYSRRINRPSYQDLNPFTFFLDPYTYQKGNPFLLPEYVNTIELGYTLKQMYNLTLGYSHTSNAMVQATVQNDTTKVTYIANQNLANENNLYANLTIPVTPVKWWSIMFNGGVDYMQFKSDYLGGQLNNGKLFFQGYLDNNFTLPAHFILDISGNYHSRIAYGVFDIFSQGSVDVGISKPVFKKKLDIKLSVSDLFNTNNNGGTTDYQTQHIQFNSTYDSRVAWLSLTYHFRENNYNQRQHGTGIEDEENRVKKAK